MTATATFRRIENFGGAARTPRHGTLTILRGASWKSGWLLAAHALAGTGDRLMPYPTGGFNSAVTAVNGGPLQIAGADANGGLRVIGKRPNIVITVANAAALAVDVSVTSGVQYTITVTPILASSTAAAVVAAIRAHALVNDLIDVTYTGTGAGLTAAVTGATVPYVRIYGVAGGEAANDDAAADAALVHGANNEQVYFGRLGFLYTTAGSLVVTPPQTVYAVDNQSVDTAYAPLCLPMWCSSYEDAMAICEIK